jgi:hypothetical protein
VWGDPTSNQSGCVKKFVWTSCLSNVDASMSSGWKEKKDGMVMSCGSGCGHGGWDAQPAWLVTLFFYFFLFPFYSYFIL